PYCCNLDSFLAIDRRQRSATASSAISILYCGQLIERKGVDVLAEAFSRVASIHQHVSLTLVGTGPLDSNLKKQLHQTIGNRIQLAGFQPVANLPRYFSNADIFVLPSRHDGWGVVVNQAIASGLPVIVSEAVGASADLVRPNVNGIIVPAGDIDRLTTAIL